jgi:torulene dioxygenase
MYAAKHWFDGFSCVHRFQIDVEDGGGPARVYYRSRRNCDEYLEIIRKTGKLEGYTFGAKRDLCESVFKKVMSMFFGTLQKQENVGVTVSLNMPGGGYVADEKAAAVNGHTNKIETMHVKTDASYLKKIDPETLEPQGMAYQFLLHPELVGAFSAAHAKSDPITGDIFNFNLKLGHPGTYRVFSTSASNGETTVLATFKSTPAYIHSLFLTENYVILCVWNSHISWGGLSLMYQKNVVDSISPFDPNSKANWYVVDRKHGKGLVATYESDPFFCFHSVNAWEETNSTDASKTDIITELSMFENTDVVHRFYYDNLISTIDTPDFAGTKRSTCLPMQAQFRLVSIESAATPNSPLPAELIFQASKSDSFELPTINPRYLTHRHRFSYGCIDRLKSSFMDGIAKFDNVAQTSILWETEGHTPGEAIFVADPEGTAEDDGVLLSVVLDGHVDKSYLLVLDARNLKELGRAEMAGPMSFGFHGAYKGTKKRYDGDI